jgi:TIR domain
MMVTVFISYSHADEELRRQLDVHLAALRRQGVVDVWHDRKIRAGEEFANEIDGALSTANIILLLVSADFIKSDYCFSIEMTEALRRHDRHDAVVIPVILRACDWHDLPFGKLRATPTDGKPVKLFADLDSAFLEVVGDIKAAALKIAVTERPPRASAKESTSPSPVLRDSQRSGNLRIKAAFSDYDRDEFRTRAFEYIARYFENSLAELQDRNEGIRTRFVRVDAVAFEAAVYAADGKQRSQCGIWLGTGSSFAGDIGYSSNGLGNRNSYNESLSVSDDGTSLGMRAMGFGFGGEDRAQLLTEEGAAERLWSLFVEPLQR